MYDCMSVRNNWLFFYEFFPYKSYFKKLFNFIFQLVSGRHVLQHYFLLHLWTTFLRKTKNSRISWGTSIPICFHIPFYQFNKRLFIVRGPRLIILICKLVVLFDLSVNSRFLEEVYRTIRVAISVGVSGSSGKNSNVLNLRSKITINIPQTHRIPFGKLKYPWDP